LNETLQQFNKSRREEYYKDEFLESHLGRMNKTLREAEEPEYKDFDITYPFIFVFGPPRSGTTLLSQLIAYSFDVGYINNLMARFWLAPLHGIRLSKSVLGETQRISFQSDYAHTSHIADIHEFGYFWRELLNIHTMEDIVHIKERAEMVEWDRVRSVLSTMQHEFRRPMVFKNIYGAYYLQHLRQLLTQVIGVYVTRDRLDAAISNIEARKRYYGDIDTWWSYTPPEYNYLREMDCWHQIAGQVYYLNRFYINEIEETGPQYMVQVEYADLCENPGKIIEKINAVAIKEWGSQIPVVNEPPDHFEFRTYSDREAEKARFEELFNQLDENGKFNE